MTESRQVQLERKLRALREYTDAMVIYWDPLGLLRQTILADKVLQLLKRAILKRDTDFVSQVSETMALYESKAKEAYEKLKAFSLDLPVNFNWRAFNNEDFRQKEIMARRMNTMVFVPHFDATGYWGSICKILHKLWIQLRNSSTDISQTITFKKLYQEIFETLKELNDQTIAQYKINVTRRKPLTFHQEPKPTIPSGESS